MLLHESRVVSRGSDPVTVTCGRCLRVVTHRSLTRERSESSSVLRTVLVMMRRSSVSGRGTSVRWRSRVSANRVHSDVRRSSTSVFSSHAVRWRRSVMHTGMRRNVLRSVHRGRHTVEMTSGGNVVTVVTSVTHVIVRLSLNLRLNPLSVGSVSNHGEDRSNSFDELGTLSRFSVIEGSLDDIVCEAVRSRDEKFSNQTSESEKPQIDSRVAKETL